MKYGDFTKKLKNDCGLQCERLDISYNDSDSRCWTAVIGKGDSNVFVTLHLNHGALGVKDFDIIANRKNRFGISESEIFENLSEIFPN